MSAVPSTMPDLGCITSAISGDPSARQEVLTACVPRIRRLVHLLWRSGDDVDDVVQTALLVVWRDLPNLRDPSRLAAWVDKVVCNVVRNEGRKRTRLHRWITVSDTVDEEPAQGPGAPDHVRDQRLFAALREHLCKIRPKKREAVVLSLFFGYSDSEIGALVGCSTETAKKRVQHGRRELIEHILCDARARALLEEVRS